MFISRRRLSRQHNWPRARTRWALDSGGFSELSLYGAWRTTPAQYAAEVTSWRGQIGRMDWAAVQDWMCEPFILAKTGKTVGEHQRRTIRSLQQLQQLAPAIPWLPVIQGFTRDDYERHMDAYERAGYELARFPVVGVGSVCKRQATAEATAIIRAIAARGIRIHAFGFKTQGIRAAREWIRSADSMAWSFQARRRRRLDGCRHHLCSNCYRYALQWRRGVMRR